MASLSYTESPSKAARAISAWDLFDGRKLNWRLLLALGVNFLAWAALVKLASNLF